jgi:suppressor for copper-sensitivity B
MILLFAFIGGLILNIMPCVLPVLSIKIMSMVKSTQLSKSKVRSSFFYTVMGILFSFMILAGFVVMLKTFGQTVSWGMQFQEPAFLIFLAIVVTIFAANQFGYFEVSLSGGLSNKINDKINAKGGNNSNIGNFLTGSFATLLATPCTAPFLSTAIAFALGSGADYIFLVFLFMGLGLAFPYILIMVAPSLIKIFPKPGAWMSKVKVILGILLILTSLWLVYVFAGNSGVYSATLLLFCLLFLFFFLRFYKTRNLSKVRSMLTVIYISAVTFVIPIYFANIHQEAATSRSDWLKFETGLIEKLVDDGNVVFVDVTADWCLTCKFNKARVVNPMHQYFDNEKIKLIKADFTKPSKLINEYLSKNDAYAIPFNKVYGPAAKDGIKLPTILTEDSIKRAVESVK